MPRRGNDNHLVTIDFRDPPAGRTQSEHVTHAGLVNHLLIELANAPGTDFLPGSEEHPEHAAVRDRAATGDSQSLRPRAGGQRSGGRVIDHTRLQVREVRGRIMSADQLNHTIEGIPWQRGEGIGAAHGSPPILDAKIAGREVSVRLGGRHPRRLHARGDGLLREHIQRVRHHVQRFQVSFI